ncbi:hypothetical protein B0I35DRAFT_492912 [Stachybotrys elegans]|uniref:Bilirubin oxidase n=1 Tax=Stachybotrys elegans TaxID=80388 RepID=A0A8K0SJJ1_9HYPO|nr:hypothetical protein B0I35DRAFT_492912 [Stachybotrys elegans]
MAQISPVLPFYEKRLPIPPQKQPELTTTNPETGGPVQYYEVEIKPFTQEIYEGMPAQFTGYDGISPGPTFIVPRGTEAIVRFVNNGLNETSVHLHGSYSRAPFDGWAEDVTQPGEYKDYYYPNQQSGRMLWYHDHAMHITAQNAYRGLAGAYILHDEAEDALNLPSGYGEFDIPLILSSKQYNEDGTLFDFGTVAGAWYGDVPHVNGIPWPFMDVEPRKYRFRFLNAAISRNFGLYFTESTGDEDSKIPFHVIASDAGLLERPVETSDLRAALAERWEIVFDFTEFTGQTIDLRNVPSISNLGTEISFENMDKIMRFNVAAETSAADNSVLPETLREVPFPTPTTADPTHSFLFARTNNQWTINGVGFSDPVNRLLANVSVGTVERWELSNTSPFWSHPIHIHLIDMRIVSRSSGRVEEYETAGLKDVVWLAKDETAVVEAHYAPWAGVYMFHCHNLIHEDDDMMAAFNTTVLPELGYNQTTYIDPMEAEWRSKPMGASDFSTRSGQFTEDEIIERIQFMTSFRPYENAEAESN